MKRIAIFIDGTWNRPDAIHPTNALRLSRCVQLYDRRTDTAQQVIYSPGVGSGRGNNMLARKMDRVLGGALGWGLLDIIEEAYRDLMFAYEPGDEVYLFGFSRGAFAARSLAGMIRSCGIAPPSNLGMLPKALQRYKSGLPSTKPDHEQSFAFRAEFAPMTATSAAELLWRAEHVPDSRAIKIGPRYVGVWDTVKALGIPKFLPGAQTFNQQYRFHNAALSSSVWSARHAMALDERRATFPASPWSNIAPLNAAVAVERARSGMPSVDPSIPPRYQEQWFPGNHGSVGGGGDITELSSIAMHWIAQGAELAGLALNWDQFETEDARFSPLGALDNKFGPKGVSGVLMNLLQADRKGPSDDETLSLAALDRCRADVSYGPKSMVQVTDRLRALSDDDYHGLRDWCVTRDGWPTHDLDGPDRPRHDPVPPLPPEA